MKIETEDVPGGKRFKATGDADYNVKYEFSDMPWEHSIYISLEAVTGGYVNAILNRKDLEKFMKASKPKKPTTQEKLKALKIGTRFITHEDGNEWIKVGEDAYMETNEELAKEAFKYSLGFAPGDVFDGKIKVVND